MRRYCFTAYDNDTRPRYIAVFGLQWQIIECQRLEPASDLCALMAATIERLAGEGWDAEGDAEYGFVFIRCGGDRRLLMLTSRDPRDVTLQLFTPFK